jgi:hypothetical protein
MKYYIYKQSINGVLWYTQGDYSWSGFDATISFDNYKEASITAYWVTGKVVTEYEANKIIKNNV